VLSGHRESARRGGRGRPRQLYAPRIVRMVYQGFFLALFLASLVLMTDAGIRRFPVRWLFHLDPLAALSVLLSSWVLPVAFLWALAIVALTVVFGRAFCGWICPVGTMHHLASWATRRLRRGPANRVNRWRPHFLIKYLLLVAVLAVALMGSLQVGLLDPLSLAARSFGSGLFPAGHALLSPGGFRPRLVQGAWLTAALFIVLLVANRWIARWWCRALCPLGALLGWISRYAIFRIKVDPELCTQCNLCATDCQGADEPFGEHRVSECHVCLNCVARCGESAITYGAFAPAAAPRGGVLLKRRQLMGSLLAGFVLWPLFRASAGSASAPGPLAIRPPGALPEDEFLARCIRCGACCNACPTAALQPSLGETGIEGLWSPVLVARLGWCEPSCTLCGQVCPTGAIRPLTQEAKGWIPPSDDPIRIGTAFFDRGRCLPWSADTPCVVCQEMCPTNPKAIWLEDVAVTGRDGQIVRLQRPHLDPRHCVGCGLCESKCPVPDRAAVRVSRAGESRAPGSSLTLAAREEL
jgi:polyferredoxin